MKRLETFGDERTLAWCAYCGRAPDTRDHIPPKIFLDRPFPPELHTVGACYQCNNSASADETYVACVIECAVTGEPGPSAIHRGAIARALDHSPALAAEMGRIRSAGATGPIFCPDLQRVERVLLKMAKAHGLYELHERMDGAPLSVCATPLPALSDTVRARFETFAGGSIYPEVGSRAFQRLFEPPDISHPGWVVVQRGRYRYMAAVGEGRIIRVVLSEYLFFEAVWDF